MIKRTHLLAAVALTLSASACSPQKEDLHILVTGDVHGAWSDSSPAKPDLMAVGWYADSVRSAAGSDNVLLLDAGDCLQGDDAAYYSNYVDTLTPHLFPRIVASLGYDAVVVGNHDIETGHPVYDRVRRQMPCPWLGGNALRPDGSPYFDEFVLLRRGGRKVLVAGYTNANIRAWLSDATFSGMDFKPLVPYVQGRVDALKASLRPDVTIVCVHSGAGKGDASMLESEGRDLLASLKGVDVLICAHDHRPFAETYDGGVKAFVNAGSKARNIAHVTIGKHGVSSSLIKVNPARKDTVRRRAFGEDFAAVAAFSSRDMGALSETLRTRDAFTGQSFYVNLLHKVQLDASGADVSFAAPLTFDATVAAGRITRAGLSTLYPYENTLVTMRLSGAEIKGYLEASYDRWIAPGDGHVLRISQKPDPRTGSAKWSFESRTYNFDSAGGLIYEVDVTRPRGNRIAVKSLSDGRRFNPDSTYTVALTSYRANGGGGLLLEGAGLSKEAASLRLADTSLGEIRVADTSLGEIRDLLGDFVRKCGTVTPLIAREGVGEWRFTPPSVYPTLRRDYSLVFTE